MVTGLSTSSFPSVTPRLAPTSHFISFAPLLSVGHMGQMVGTNNKANIQLHLKLIYERAQLYSMATTGDRTALHWKLLREYILKVFIKNNFCNYVC